MSLQNLIRSNALNFFLLTLFDIQVTVTQTEILLYNISACLVANDLKKAKY